MFEEALTARILASNGLSPLISTRANWGQRPQKDPLPGLTMLNVSPGRFYLHSGADATGNPRVQFDLYGANSEQANTLKRALIAEMETPSTHLSVDFSVALLDAERGPLIEDVGGGAKAHRVSLDFFVWFSPAA